MFDDRRAAIGRALCTVATLLAPTLVSAGTFLPLDPKATYLHTHQDLPAAPGALAVNLASLGYAAGDQLLLQVQGDIDNGPGGDSFSFTMGLFSSGDVLLGTELLQRVPGALASDGPAFVSSNTFFGNQPTDIAEDFGFDRQQGIVVTVPPGAQYLFLAKSDQLYNDNSDPDHDYGVVIGLAPVPEPATWVLLAGGLAALLRRSWRRA